MSLPSMPTMQSPAAGYAFTQPKDAQLALSNLGESPLILDFCTLPRFGMRGPGAAAVMEQWDLPIPSAINTLSYSPLSGSPLIHNPSGEAILRLGKTECWVLGALADQGERVKQWQKTQYQSQELPVDAYPLACQHSHAWFVLAGEHKAQLMAKLCAVDLAPASFPENTVCQTSVARLSAVIAHHLIAGKPVFSIFCDISYADYLAGVLVDASAEFTAAKD